MVPYVLSDSDLAPPQTRGWTWTSSFFAPLSQGSPANAGMDLKPQPHRSRDYWLPRKRGDGPMESQLLTELHPAPPQTRGWTRSKARTTHTGSGSPANAGMDLSSLETSDHLSWLPRKRGDGPHIVISNCT